MAASYSQTKTTLNNVGALVYDSLVTDMEAIISDLATVRTNYNGDNKEIIENLIRDARNTMATMIESGPHYQLYTQALLEMAQAAGYAGTDVLEGIDWLRQYMDDVGIFAGGAVDERITARGITRGTVNSPTNTTVKRLTVDQWGQNIQAGNAETMRIEVTSTASDTNRTARIHFQVPGQDIFDLAGSGRSPVDIQLIDEYNPGVMTNSQMVHGVANGGSVLTANLSGWTLTGTWTSSTSLYFNTLASTFSAAAAARVEQAIPAVDPTIPYIPYAWVYTTSATNNIDLDWGNDAQNFTSFSANQWQLLVPTMDSKLWPVQFDQAGAELAVEINSTSGTVSIGMVGLAPLTLVGDTWFAIFTSASGATVSIPVLGAVNTIADTLSVAGKHAHIQSLFYGKTLPASSGTNNIDSIS